MKFFGFNVDRDWLCCFYSVYHEKHRSHGLGYGSFTHVDMVSNGCMGMDTNTRRLTNYQAGIYFPAFFYV